MDAFQLPFARLRLNFRAREFLRLPPYKGSTFRGAFGMTFKRTVCIVQHQECERCLVRNQCVYPYVFDTPADMGDATGIFKGFQEAPHPYVIEPPLETQTDYAPGDTFTIGLTVLGRALNHLPYFVYTFHRMGETGVGRGRGKCDLISADAQAADGTWMLAYEGAQEALSDIPTLSTQHLACDFENKVKIRFVTPTQLKVDNSFRRGLNFQVLIRGLLRRYSALATFHGGGTPDLDYGALVAEAENVKTTHHNLNWQTWERYSNRKSQRMKVSGFTGEVAFEGNLSVFKNLLALGVPIHVGKWTSFGMGQYALM